MSYGALAGHEDGIWGTSESCKSWFWVDGKTQELSASVTVDEPFGDSVAPPNVVVDGEYVYCAYTNSMARAPRDLSSPPEEIVSLDDESRVYGLAQDDGYVYLLYDLPGGAGHHLEAIDKMTLEREVIENEPFLRNHDLQYDKNSGWFYFIQRSVQRWRTGVSSYERVAKGNDLRSYAVDSEYVFWGGRPGIARVQLP